MTYDPRIHQRRSLRLKGWDYTQPGAYFITIVSQHRQEIFGQVFNEQMELSRLGGILRDEWLRSITIRKEICLHDDEFVVMPNHMHAIVWIIDPLVGGLRPAPTLPARPQTQSLRRTQTGSHHGTTPTWSTCAPTLSPAQISRADTIRPYKHAFRDH